MLLSAFDVRWPGYIPRLVSHLDECGYARFWTTEHHSPVQSGSPTVLASIAAAASRELSIGTLGLKMRYYSPLRVATDFHLLQLFFPNRIDLGVIDGAIGDSAVDLALLDNRPVEASFHDKIAQLAQFIRDPGNELTTRTLCRGSTHGPRLWVGSTSAASAAVTGRLGMGFAIHAAVVARHGREQAVSIIRSYRERFCPSPTMPEPQIVLVCFGCCGSSPNDALAKWDNLFGAPHGDLTTETRNSNGAFCGDPQQVADQLYAVAAELGASEVAIQCHDYSFDSTLASYTEIAKAVGLRSRMPTGCPGSAGM